MLVNSKQYVPLIYRSSRDYEAVLRLLDIVLTTTKYEIDTLINLYIPEKCQEEFLPLLAEHIGYKYNYSDSVNTNRIVIGNFIKMIRNRGSITGIKLATALSLNNLDDTTEIFGSDVIEKLDVFFDYDTGTIIIYYPTENNKVRDLLDWVRPVGMKCSTLPAIDVDDDRDIIKANLDIHSSANVTVIPYSSDIFSKVESSEIFDGLVDQDITIGTPYTWKDCLNFTWETIAQYTWEDFLSGTDVTRSITVTFDGDGGTFYVPNVITTFTGYTITTIGRANVIKGIDRLEKWVDVNTGIEYEPNTEILISSLSNVTLKARWKTLQQHQFIIDLDNLSTIPTQIEDITTMYLNTPWHILVEHQETNSNTWTIVDILNPSTTSLDYTISQNSGKLRISLGYDYVTGEYNFVNYSSFSDTTNTLYNLSSVIDFSKLTEITTDIFDNIPNGFTFVNNNNYVTDIILPPNIVELTIPNYFISNCSNLQNVTFPQVPCNFIFKQTSGSYGTYFLYNAGTNDCRLGEFTIPSNITIVYEDYDNYVGNNVTFFSGLRIAKTININCNFTTDNIESNIVPQIAMSFYNQASNSIDYININGICDLSALSVNNIVGNLYISPQCSIDNYIGSTDLSSIANVITIDTDNYGATTRIKDSLLSGGNVLTINLGTAISSIGEWSISSLPNLLTIELPINITTVPKTALQNNANLYSINFNTSDNLTIQGFHNLSSLVTVIIPNNCYDLNTCFYGCTNLTTINLGNVTNFDYETSFVNCSGITTVIDNSTIYNVINNIVYNASGNYLLWIPWSISNVIIPNNVTDIGEYSFSGCPRNKLYPYIVNGATLINADVINYYNSVVIPETVNTIHSNAFNLTNITKLRILNATLDLTNLSGASITEIEGYINSTAHIYANTNNITFTPIDDMTNNINANITDILGTNIL